jgi:hypothetical protein
MCSCFFAADSQPDEPLLAPYRFAGSALLCVAGVGILINAVVINVDPQGALILIFLPLGQWLFLALLERSLRLLPSMVGGVP